jgi:hypothetical protein
MELSQIPARFNQCASQSVGIERQHSFMPVLDDDRQQSHTLRGIEIPAGRATSPGVLCPCFMLEAECVKQLPAFAGYPQRCS